MKHEIRNKPDFASLHFMLDTGDQVVTEAGAMMGMSSKLNIETNMKGGLLGAASRALGGESVFLNTYTATEDGQRLDVAPSMPGDMVHVPMTGTAVMVQRGSFCASTTEVTVNSKWGGAKTFFGGEGLIMLRCEGLGDLWMSSYGAIHAVQVDGSYTVDTGHIVAFESSLSFKVKTFGGGWKQFIFGGEGLICTFSGKGRLWLQTRNPQEFGKTIGPKLPMREN